MKFLKIILYLFLSIIIVTLLYFSTAYLLEKFPKQHKDNKIKTKHIYLLYDEMHTDIILNLETSNIPWKKLLPEILEKYNKGYIGVGWGDKETYLHTPTWDDLKLTIAFKALFINTPSLIHVTYYRKIKNFKDLYPIKVNKNQYQNIEKLLLKSFGKTPQFTQRGNWYSDAFYDSPYSYNLIETCNTWTGDILRESNISMSYWTPFSSNVINSLP